MEYICLYTRLKQQMIHSHLVPVFPGAYPDHKLGILPLMVLPIKGIFLSLHGRNT